MIKILTSEQVKELDKQTILNEPITSLELMERAAQVFFKKFLDLFPHKRTVKVFCGTGNNGGDALIIGRLLKKNGWDVHIYVVGDTQKGSEDFRKNLNHSPLYAVIKSEVDFPEIEKGFIVIDGLFGSGLSRPVEGIHAELITYLNRSGADRVAIDIASGLYSGNAVEKDSVVFEPHFTISFQTPKLPFFLPDSHQYVGEWFSLDIGLDKKFIESQETNYYLLQQEDFKGLLPTRHKFTHKSEAGKLLIVGGSKGKIGAMVLSARASFKSGVGLVNVCVPKCGTDILQVAIPEAMVFEGEGENYISKIPEGFEGRVAIGPGLGINQKTTEAFEAFLKRLNEPIVLDADAINILAENRSLLELVPIGSILTPHPGEFRRLAGEWKNDFEKLEKLKSFCKDFKLNAVVKGAYSAICSSNGEIAFNPSGNSAMATAGSGDVLTGIVGSMLAQGLKPLEALKLSVYVHGVAGDLAVGELKQRHIQASDIINFIPKAFSTLF